MLVRKFLLIQCEHIEGVDDKKLDKQAQKFSEKAFAVASGANGETFASVGFPAFSGYVSCQENDDKRLENVEKVHSSQGDG